MATRKTGSSSRKTTKKAPTASKSTTKVRAVSASTRTTSSGGVWTDNVANILVAELVGTFVLTSVALLSLQLVAPLYVGITLAILVFAIGAVSGAHVNPAVTFGLWSMRKLKTVLVPVYWVAQLLGALAAVVLLDLVAGTKFSLDLTHFNSFNWSIFAVEMIGATVFLFGVGAVVSRDDVKAGAKAFGVGLSLTVGLIVASSFLAQVTANADQSDIKVDPKTGAFNDVPHELRVGGAILNPAIALATNEKTDAELSGNSQANSNDKHYSRFGWEVILGTLVGAALGGNLYLLVNARFRKS